MAIDQRRGKMVRLFLAFIFSINIVASTKISCGNYFLQGSIKRLDRDLYLVANEKSKSEYRFRINDRSKFNALNFINQTVHLTAHITKVHSPFSFDISIKEIKEENKKVVFNPSMITEIKCQK